MISQTLRPAASQTEGQGSKKKKLGISRYSLSLLICICLDHGLRNASYSDIVKAACHVGYLPSHRVEK